MRGALPVGRRLLAGLRGDRRTLALVVGAPVFIVFLFSEVLSAPERVAHVLLGLFVFILTYLLTAIGFLRERTSGTLERVLAAPVSRTGLVLGYVLGFGALAAVQTLVLVGAVAVFLDQHEGLDRCEHPEAEHVPDHQAGPGDRRGKHLLERPGGPFPQEPDGGQQVRQNEHEQPQEDVGDPLGRREHLGEQEDNEDRRPDTQCQRPAVAAQAVQEPSPDRDRPLHRSDPLGPPEPPVGASRSSRARKASSRSEELVASRKPAGVSKANTSPARRNSTRSQWRASPR